MSHLQDPRPGVMDMNRRCFLLTGGAAAVSLALLSACAQQNVTAPTPAENFEVTHTDEQWKRLLNPAQYEVLREAGTEAPFSSPLDGEHRHGVFGCAGCALDLFSSDTKFDSGTGWPSFWKPLDNAVLQGSDTSLDMARIEVRCRRCGGHIGHVFDDGPPPTGLRYCMNGVAMGFRPA